MTALRQIINRNDPEHMGLRSVGGTQTAMPFGKAQAIVIVNV